jgi:acetylornithine deacetylase/succinyl-diaminopimelate desuccinylase-like protein
MLWMSHSDVVPAGDESAWTHGPFSADLEGGRIWGRGANDCKMLVAAQLFALACLARLGLPARGRVALAAGADEEVGGQLGFGYLAREHAEFLRADLAVCEGGGSPLNGLDAPQTILSLGTGEKGRYDVHFRLTSDGGHASSPWGKRNPVAVAAQLIQRIEALEHPAAPASPVFECLSGWLGMDGPITVENLEDAIAQASARAPELMRSLKGQSRMTLTPTVIHAGDKANAIPTEAALTCDARLLPGQTQADLERAVREVAEGLPGVSWKIQGTCEPSYSNHSREILDLFGNASARALGRPVTIAPVWCIGATDAHWVRALGTPVYGFQLIHPDADPARLGIHCIDESIEARMLLPCALALAHLAVDFLD